MSFSNYFKNHPTITYNNQIVSNILSKIMFLDKTINETSILYDYTIKEGERPDILANKFYGDSKYDWILLAINKIYDIYTQWPLSNIQLEEKINSKYGSFSAANSFVDHYEDLDGDIIDEKEYFRLAPGHRKLITGYEYEVKENDRKRSIRLIEDSYIPQLDYELNLIRNNV